MIGPLPQSERGAQGAETRGFTTENTEYTETHKGRDARYASMSRQRAPQAHSALSSSALCVLCALCSEICAFLVARPLPLGDEDGDDSAFLAAGILLARAEHTRWRECVRSSSVSTAATLPRWDVSVVFPSLESPEFVQGFQAAVAAIEALGSLFDAEGIQRRGSAPPDDAAPAPLLPAGPRYNHPQKHARTPKPHLL